MNKSENSSQNSNKKKNDLIRETIRLIRISPNKDTGISGLVPAHLDVANGSQLQPHNARMVITKSLKISRKDWIGLCDPNEGYFVVLVTREALEEHKKLSPKTEGVALREWTVGDWLLQDKKLLSLLTMAAMDGGKSSELKTLARKAWEALLEGSKKEAKRILKEGTSGNKD